MGYVDMLALYLNIYVHLYFKIKVLEKNKNSILNFITLVSFCYHTFLRSESKN